MYVVLALLATLTLGTLIGWFIHWMMHQNWSGRLYKSHMTHHLNRYPPKDLLSEEYRDAGSDSGLFVFVPIITIGLAPVGILLYFLGVPWTSLLATGTCLSLVGVAHDVIHTAFHIRGSWLERFKWFRVLRARHFLHHRNMRKNLGILFYGWDHVLRTWRSPETRDESTG